MATSSRPFASFDTKLASGRFGSSNVSRSGRGCRCFRDNRGEQYSPLVHCNVDVRTGFRILLTGEIGRCSVHFINKGGRDRAAKGLVNGWRCYVKRNKTKFNIWCTTLF